MFLVLGITALNMGELVRKPLLVIFAVLYSGVIINKCPVGEFGSLCFVV